jgi:hypothetical protein
MFSNGNWICLPSHVQRISITVWFSFVSELFRCSDCLIDTKFTHVQLHQICGDNLGLHTILGFCESFNAKYRCRFCKADKENTYRCIEEIEGLRRTIANYNADVVANNVSLTGIKQNSVVNQIKNFHVALNFAPDIMHDIFEGICILELKLILNSFLQRNVLSLVEINHRVSSSIKGHGHSIGKIPEISSKFIDGDLKSCFSASEMSNFFLLFPVIFGDKVNIDDMKLRRIIRILMAPKISNSALPLLQFLIAEHHQFYIKLSQTNLTPKFHHLLHYCSPIEQLGPLKSYWCMRFEAKHRFSKTVGKTHTILRTLQKPWLTECL